MAARGATWSADETRPLISLWGEESIQAQLEGIRHNNKIYRDIAESLVKAGFPDRDGKQCQEKIKKLKVMYRKVLDNNGRSGKGRKEWEHFDQMHEILGTRPMSRPSILLQSAKKKPKATKQKMSSTASSSATEDTDLLDVTEGTSTVYSNVDDEDDDHDEDVLPAESDNDEDQHNSQDDSIEDSQPGEKVAKRKNMGKPKQVKKGKTQKAVEAACSNFITLMKETDEQFVRAERERRQSDEQRMQIIFQQQKEMEEKRLAMEERMRQQEREHEFKMMKMILQMSQPQPQMPVHSHSTPMPGTSMPNNSTTISSQIPPFSTPMPSTSMPNTSATISSQIPPFSAFGPYEPNPNF